MSTNEPRLETQPATALARYLPFGAGVASLSASLFLSPLQILAAIVGAIMIPFMLVSSVGVLTAITVTSHIETLPMFSESVLYLLKWVVTVFFLALALLRKVTTGEQWNWSFARPGVSLLILLAWSMICVPFSVHPLESAVEIVRYFLLFVVFIVTREITRDERSLIIVAFSLLIALAAASSYSLWQFWTEGFFRLRGFFTNPNSFGVFVGFTLPFALLLAMVTRSRVLKFAVLACTVPALVSLGFSWSRAAMFGIAVQVLVFLLLERQWPWIKRMAFVGLIVATAVLINPALRESIMTATRFTGGTSHRTLLWGAATESIMKNPTFGQGYGLKQNEVVGRIIEKDVGVVTVFRDFRTKNFLPHNQLLVHALATGVPGLVLALVFYTSIIAYFNRARIRAISVKERMLQSGAIALICGALANGLFEGGLIFGKGAINNYFWIALGIAAAASRHQIFSENQDKSISLSQP